MMRVAYFGQVSLGQVFAPDELFDLEMKELN